MRIENNNNVSFGAYFKNNTNFKKVFADSYARPQAKLMDKFTHEYPNHEVEILDIIPENLKNVYKVFNNTLGKGMIVRAQSGCALNTIIEYITDDSKNDFFWNRTETVWTDAYKQLTNSK